MNEQEWERMRAEEEGLWWYKALHRFLLRFLTATNKTGGAAVLDVGCGTGGFLDKLARRGYRVFGLDMSPLAIRHVNARGIATALVASANCFPFRDESFDMVTCIDMLECESVSPSTVASEAFRVLKPGGYCLFQMAAHQWLLSEHDRAVHSVRRFNLRQFRNLFAGTGFQVIYASYLFLMLFPAMALWKVMHRPMKDVPRSAAISDVKPVSPLLNQLRERVRITSSRHARRRKAQRGA
ncbi:MAG: class I SAM-dependent methyltransferase [Candidatus Lindowbacteria bacterium]|nr:class I SAM-dependent methyltransferase [Candidatus Lindowbacteria bacterium]